MNYEVDTTEYKVIVTDKETNTEHLFSEGTTELAYLGPSDICPKEIAEIAEDYSGKPVK